jgi:hypothetical protein
MKEQLIDRLSKDIENFVKGRSSDWNSNDLSIFLRSRWGALNNIESEFSRIGEAINDPIGGDFFKVATIVEKNMIRLYRLESCLEEIYSIACNGCIDENLLCMQEAKGLLDDEDSEKYYIK